MMERKILTVGRQTTYWRFLWFGCLLTLLVGPAPAALLQEPPTLVRSLALSGDDYVSIPHAAALNPSSAITVEAWVARSNDSRCETIVSKGFTSAWWLGFCNERIRFYGSGFASAQDGQTSIPAGIWTHIAVTYQAGAARRYYINGELDYVGPAVDGPMTSNSLPVQIGRDPDGGFTFDGQIGHVRVWNVARSQNQIRRYMHVSLDEPLPGLVASWRLAGFENGGYSDAVGGFDGSPVGAPSFPSLSGSRAQTPRVQIDEYFAQLPGSRYLQATVAVPEREEMLMIGGITGVTVRSTIDRVDAVTGEVTENIGDLPQALAYSSAAYVSSSDTVYTFGGSTSRSQFDPGVTNIYAINATNGAVREVLPGLPQALSGTVAIYHPVHHKIYIFGGRVNDVPMDTVYVFDPDTEQLTGAAGVSLPNGQSHMGAAFSPIDGQIYLFGGLDQSSSFFDTKDTIWQFSAGSDGEPLMVVELVETLAGPDSTTQAAFDPTTGLIYLLSGNGRYWVSAFDPATKQFWRTRIALPDRRLGASAVISPTGRHALIVGGDSLVSFADVFDIWRVPLGDAPAVAISDWQFPPPVPSLPTTIHGSGRGVAIGTFGDGAYRIRADLSGRANYSPANLGSSHANDVAYEPTNDHVWISTESAGGRLRGSASINYNSDVIGTSQARAVDIRPGYESIDEAPLFGANNNGLNYRRFISGVVGEGSWQWRKAFDGQTVSSIDHRQRGDIWVIANDRLQHLQIGFAAVETDYGNPCGLATFRDIEIASNGDWWLAADAGEFGNGICRIPAGATPGEGALLNTNIGNRAQRISEDSNGRVWIALGDEVRDFSSTLGVQQSGGLSVWESIGGSLRSDRYNWLDAPVGGRRHLAGGTTSTTVWDSSLAAVGAVDERIWIGKPDGQLITHTPRWRSIDEARNLRFYDIRRIGFARGRAFVGGEWGFHVLQPDGITWDTRFDFGFRDVLGDRQGRTWLATSAGIRLFQSSGYDDLSDREGLRPSWPLHALAEDHHGRVWIGGDNGLTLYDRERFVLTLSASNSELPASPVQALFVDSGNRLWIGTSNGLARLEEDRMVTFSSADGLPGNNIRDIDQLGTGEIVVSAGGGAGLAVWDGRNFFALPAPYPASDYPISVDQDGRLWAGRAVRVDEEWVEYHTTNSGLVSQTVYDQAADLGDRVWFAHGSNGMSVRGSNLPQLANSVPVISSVSQLSGTAGDEIVIQGSGFSTRRRGTRVFIGGAEAEVRNRSETEVRVRLTPENTSGPISVQVDGQRTTWGQNFCAIPTISHFTPTGGNDGMRVSVYGSNFDRTVAFSAGGVQRNASASPEEFSFTITNNDDIGALVVRNLSFGCNQSASSELTFQRIGVDVDRVALNQGHISLGLAGNKPTLVQHYLTTDRFLRTAGGYDDRLEIDRLRLRFTQAGAPARTFNVPIATRPPTWPLPWTEESAPPSAIDDIPPAWYEDLAMSLHATVTPFVPGGDQVTVQSTLFNSGLELTRNTRSVDMRNSDTLNVLLVPIMPNDYSRTELDDMRSQTDGGLDDARQRLFSFGRVNFYWSPNVVRPSDIFGGSSTTVDPLNVLDLFTASHSLERARRSWNGNPSRPSATIAYGVVHPRASSQSGAVGKAFWPDISLLVNALGLGAIDALCEFTDGVVEFFSLGLLGGEGCDIAIPLYVGWSSATSNASRLIGHEVGHILGLVRSHAANGSPTSNPTHSVQDEISGDSTCNDLFDPDPATYARSRTLYRSSGFEGPAVNPLTGRQYLPALSDTATSGDGSVTSGALVGRGKSIMSYACARGNRNVFFEPADVNHLRFDMDPLVLGLGAGTAQAGSGTDKSDRSSIRTRAIEGRRLIVSGQVDRDAISGTLIEVKTLGELGPLDANYETGWRLIQRDQNGNELARQGIFPVFVTTEHSHGHRHGRSSDSGAQESSLGFFAATLVGASGVTEIELSYQDTVLDAYSAGSGVPSVSITSPSPGSSHSSGSVPVSWTASDQDGDPLTLTIEYSADNGTSWLPVGYGEGSSGTVELPIAVLAGGSQARVRVTVSDGFQSATTTSATFTVADQPPTAYIGAPDDSAVYLEGEPVRLSGGAWDAATLDFDPMGLFWQSDRDGELGQGAVLDAMLSVGTHLITLEAINAAGLSDIATLTVTIRGDYDGDGVADDDEFVLGFSPLLRHDAWTDQDGDDLPWLMEDRWGTDPGEADTSESGRSDADDIAGGLDPLDADFILPHDALTVTPPSVQLFHNRRLGTLNPHVRLQVASQARGEWTVSTNRGWLRPLRSSGITPDTVTVTANSDGLPNGVYQAILNFNSSLGNVQIPVSLTVQGSPVPIEDFIFQDRFQTLVDRLYHQARSALSPAPQIASSSGMLRRFPLANADGASLLAVLRAQRADRSARESDNAGETR